MMDEDRGYWYPAIQIGAGILIASAVLGVAGYLFTAYQVDQATKAMSRVSKELAAENQAALAQRQAAAQTKADAENARQAAERQRAQDAAIARQEGIAQMEAKMRAWNRFYQTPPECEKPANWDTQVECGNKYIRAQKVFEDRWAQGQLR